MSRSAHSLWTTDPGFDSPVIEDDGAERVFVQYPSGDENQLVALNEKTGRVEWQQEMPATFSTVLTDGTLYYATTNELVAMDAATGTTRWRNRFADNIHHRSVRVPDETPYIYTRNRDADRYEWFALDEDGGRRWSFRKRNMVYFRGIVNRRVLFVASGTVYCVNGTTGNVEWTRAARKVSPVVHTRIFTVPEGNGDEIVVLHSATGSVRNRLTASTHIHDFEGIAGEQIILRGTGKSLDDHAYVAISTTEDDVAWDRKRVERKPRFARGRGNFLGPKRLKESPSGYLFLEPTDGEDSASVTAVDAETGRDAWEFPVSGANLTVRDAPAAGVTLIVEDATVYALETQTGSREWSFSDAKSPVPVVSGRELLVLDREGVLYLLDPGSGEVDWRYEFDHTDPGEVGPSAVHIGDSAVYVTDGQTLCALPRVSSRESLGAPTDGDTAVYDQDDTDTRVFSDDATYCPDCGTDLDEYGDANFCPECGTDLSG